MDFYPTCTLITDIANTCHSAILNLRPTSLSQCTGSLPFMAPGELKGAAILRIWVALCNSDLWDAGSGCPFLFWDSHRNTMATFQAKMYQQQTDPETGCASYDERAFQACREVYFLKQQNEILKNQQSSSNNGDGDSKVMGTTTEAQVQGQANNNLAAVEAATGGFSFSPTYVLIFITAIIIMVGIIRYFTKKKEDEIQIVFFRKTPKYPNNKSDENNKSPKL